MDDATLLRRARSIEAIGRRFTTTIPTGQWETMHTDPRTGIIEYQLTNIRRAEPPPDLFVIPPDYTIRRDPSETWITLQPALKGRRGGR